MTAERVLIVDDDASVREALRQTVELADLRPTTAGSYIEAKDHICEAFDGVVLTDIRMPGKDGFALLNYAQTIDPELPVILLTGDGDIPMAVRGMSEGAYGFLEKPCAPAELLSVLTQALKTRMLVLENRRLKQQLQSGDAAARLVFGQSRLAEELRARTRAAARTTADVLVAGAPGTGTSKIAEVIHMLSGDARRPFVKRAAVTLTPETLGAAFRAAKDGTVFLHEVASLGPDTQIALADLMETQPRARLIAGTYRDLREEATEGRFNLDLFYRLDVMPVRIPSLNERRDDIPELFRQYVAIACEQAALPEPEITPEYLGRLMAQDWPGNTRALMNAAMRFAMGLPDGADEESLGLTERMAQVERSMLIEALRRAGGNATEAARALKLPRKTFYDKLAKHGLRADEYR